MVVVLEYLMSLVISLGDSSSSSSSSGNCVSSISRSSSS